MNYMRVVGRSWCNNVHFTLWLTGPQLYFKFHLECKSHPLPPPPPHPFKNSKCEYW